jgi:hypothetical protein
MILWRKEVYWSQFEIMFCVGKNPVAELGHAGRHDVLNALFSGAFSACFGNG